MMTTKRAVLMAVLAVLPVAAHAQARPTLRAPRVSSHPVVGPLVTYLVDPCRFLDSRDTTVFWYEEEGPFRSESFRYYRLQGSCGVPLGADGAIVNVTITGATAEGHLQLYDAYGHDGIPPTSLLNFQPGQTVANGLTLRLSRIFNPGIDADFRVFVRMPAGGTVHVIVDVVGYLVPYASSSSTKPAPSSTVKRTSE